MTVNDQVRADLAVVLARYLCGEATVDDILAFEGPYSLDEKLDPDLRRNLDLLALIGEEVEFLDRPQADMDAVVREIATQLRLPVPTAAASAEAAAD